jgi:hypothetical protein
MQKNSSEKVSTKSPQTATRNNEPLWEYCKQEALEKMGKFSARAMQYAVKLYKERGGGYLGEKSSSNSLVKWTKEDKQSVKQSSKIAKKTAKYRAKKT